MSEREPTEILYDLEPTQTFRLQDGVDIPLDELEERARDINSGELAGFGTIFDPNAGAKKNSGTRVKVNMSSDGLALYDSKTKISHRWARAAAGSEWVCHATPGIDGDDEASVPDAAVASPIGKRPRELPDLRRVDTIGIDIETKDDGIREDRGSSWPWCGGYIVGVSVALARRRRDRSLLRPDAHPDSDNFDRVPVYRWIMDHIAAGEVVTTKTPCTIGAGCAPRPAS